MERYSRQTLFPGIGKEGQKKLQASSVLIVGVGALGTVISSQLARAGVGYIHLVDRDYVELSNLQRQMLFAEEDVSLKKPKAIAAKEKLKKINSDIQIHASIAQVSQKNIDELTENIDLIFDGTDNFRTRFLLNDIAYQKNIPFVYGGVISSRGMSAFLIPGKTPCLRCFMNHPKNDGETCDTVGVISPAVHIVTSMQVTEALKFLTGQTEELSNRLIFFDIWKNEYVSFKNNQQNPQCPTCKRKEYPALKSSTEEIETTLCGRNTVQIHREQRMDLRYWQEKLHAVAQTNLTPFLLEIKLNDGIKLIIFKDGRVLIQGTEDIVYARTLYDRYIGS